MGVELNKTGLAPMVSNGTALQAVDFTFAYRVEQTKGVNRFKTMAAAKFTGGLDLDLYMLMFNDLNEVVSAAGPSDPDPFHGAVMHMGDTKAGTSGEAMETIRVNLPEVPSTVHSMVLASTAFGKSGAFDKLAQAGLVVTNAVTGATEDQLLLSIENGVQAALLSRLVRADNPSGWSIEPVRKTFARVSDWRDLASQARNEIGGSRNRRNDW